MAKTNQDATKKSTGPEEMSKEELVVAVKELQEKNESADEKIKELTEKYNSMLAESEKTISDLEQQLKTQSEDSANAIIKIEGNAEEFLMKAKEKIMDLQSKLEALTSSDSDIKSFKSEGIEYQILVAKLRWEGQVITAEEIITNDKLREAILAFAWKGRSEADFNKNGIFKIVY